MAKRILAAALIVSSGLLFSGFEFSWFGQKPKSETKKSGTRASQTAKEIKPGAAHRLEAKKAIPVSLPQENKSAKPAPAQTESRLEKKSEEPQVKKTSAGPSRVLKPEERKAPEKSENKESGRNMTEEESGEAPAEALKPEDREKEIAQIEGELKDILEKTTALQESVGANRAEIQKIVERARIHNQILKTIRIPKPVRTGAEARIDHVLAAEKVRVIGDQARRTQQQIRILEQTRRAQAASKVVRD